MFQLTEKTAIRRLREQIAQLKKDLDLPYSLVYQGLNDHVTKCISSKLDVDIIEADLLPADEGQYLPANPPLLPRPIIAIDPRIGSEERLSFTFFREVTHHLIRTDDVLYKFLHEMATGSEFSTALERLCQNGAAEFLIALNDVRKSIDERGFSIRLVEFLDMKYGASKPAISIQMAQAANHSCVTVVCVHSTLFAGPVGAQQALRIKLGPKQPQLYILYSSSSPSFKYTTGRFIPVPEQHILAEAFREQCFVNSRDTILFKRARGWPTSCEAFYYKGCVFGVFNHTLPRPPLTLQPRLPNL